jgi:hypothetical protein
VSNQLDAHIVKAGDKAARVTLDRAGIALGTDLVVRWAEASPALDLRVRAAKTNEKGRLRGGPVLFHRISPDATPPASSSSWTRPCRWQGTRWIAKELVEALRLLNARDRIALLTFDAEVRSWSAHWSPTSPNKSVFRTK